MKIEFNKRELDRALKTLDNLDSKSQREILVKSVNDSLRSTLEMMRSDLPKFIDRPKAITLRSLYVAFMSTSNLKNAFIAFKFNLGKKEAGHHWVAPLVFGGRGKEKGLDKILKSFGILPDGYTAIPTKDIRLDGYGNVRGKYVTKMISYLKINMDTTQNRNSKNESKRRKQTMQRWFIVRINNNNKIKPGIYESGGSSFNRKVRMVFMFKKVSYKKIYPFFETAQAYASKLLQLRISERFKSAMSVK